MPERYDRSACANELLLRNTIAQRMRSGWEIAPAFRLPITVTGETRIGREPLDSTADDKCEAKSEHLAQPLAPNDIQATALPPAGNTPITPIDGLVVAESEIGTQPASIKAQDSQVKETLQTQTEEST